MISPIPKKMQSNSKILSVLIALNIPKENISAVIVVYNLDFSLSGANHVTSFFSTLCFFRIQIAGVKSF